MDLMDGLFTRRSIRRFTGEPPSLETMKHLVKAGIFAATAGNGQPWRFIIVLDAATVETVTDALGWLGGKPGPDERPRAHIVILTPAGGNWAQEADGAAAAQNILLAAHGLGLGGCWFGSIKRPKVVELLAIPEDWQIFSIMSIGGPAEAPPIAVGSGRPSRDDDGVLVVPKKPLDEVLSVDSFQSADQS